MAGTVTLKEKLAYLCKTYMPVPMFRLAKSIWNFLKPSNNKPEGEIIPYW